MYGLKCLCENLKSVACIQSNTEYNVLLVVSWGDNHKTRGYYYTYSSPVKTRNKPTCRFCIGQVTNKLISLFPAHCSSTLLWRGCYSVIHSMRFPQDVQDVLARGRRFRRQHSGQADLVTTTARSSVQPLTFRPLSIIFIDNFNKRSLQNILIMNLNA